MTPADSGRRDDGRAAIEAALRALEPHLDRSLQMLRGRAGSLDMALACRLRMKLVDMTRALERPLACECGVGFRFPGQLDDHRRNVHGVER